MSRPFWAGNYTPLIVHEWPLHPLSATQRDFYLHHAREPSSTVHLIGVTCRLGRDVQPDRWVRAVEIVLAEEPTSRTKLAVVDGEVRQQVDGSVPPLRCRTVDLDGSHTETETASAFLERERRQPFDLFALPLWRAYLVREHDGSHVAAVLAPHIFVDGPSFRLLFKRFDRCYRSLDEVRTELTDPRPTATEPAGHPDEAPAVDAPATLRFWDNTLSAVEPIGEPSSSSTDRWVQVRNLGSHEVEQMRRFCRAQGWPFAMFLRAVYVLLVRRLTGTTGDQVVLDVRDARRPEQKSMIGCHVRTLPILVGSDLTVGDATIDQLVTALTENAEIAEEFSDVSSLALNGFLPPGSLRCYFDFYVFETVEVLGERRRLHSHLGYADDEMHLVPSLTPDGISLKLDYPTGRLAGERFLERFLSIIDQLMAGATSLGQIDVLLEGEPRVIGASPAAATPTPMVVERITEHAAIRPDAVAVSAGPAAVTYAELTERAHRLAHHLRDLDVGPGTFVGVALGRSPELIIAILAVLEAGGAYVPLDPAHPTDRLESMLVDSGASLLLTTGEIGRRFGDLSCPVVDLAGDPHPVDDCPAELPMVHIGPNDPAYVIYTSGSTGRPKGVVVTHGNLVALLAAAEQTFDLDDHDVWTMSHSVAFDYSVWEMFGALAFGGRLVVVGRDASRSPEDVLGLIHDEGVTVLSQTPTAFSALSSWAARSGQLAPSSLRYIVFGGEKLQLDSLRDWVDHHGDTHPELVNMFGITETTVHVTHRRITRADIDAADGRSLIGNPLPGWVITLRDSDGGPVPPGVAGEILVGGDGVASGYLGRPELEAERFVELDDQPGQRWYRSGDLGRIDRDGELEYLGRVDEQVKIRGFRIEPGEVAAALLDTPGVTQAAVVAVDHDDDRRLVGYVVPEPGSAPIEADLRRRLGERLPDHMIPWRVLSVDELPLTANGKLDRRALPVPGTERPDGEAPWVAPTTPVQLAIARIWEEVLGIGPIGVDDQFFALGGNSLGATQMMLRVQDRLDTRLPLCTAFEHTTVAALAEAVTSSGGSASARPKKAGADIPPPRPDGLLPLTFAQERAWFIQQLDPANIAYHFTSTLTWNGSLDVDALQRALSELVRRHEVLRTTFPSEAGQPHQLVHAPWSVDLIVDDVDDTDVELLTHREAARPFALDELPLIRWRLLRLTPTRHVLVHVEHHLLHDGWSFAVLLRELLALYGAYAAGLPADLPPTLWQCADVALTERAWIETDAADDQLSFWVDRLKDVPHVLELPADRQRSAVDHFRGDAVRICLDDDLGARVEAYSRSRGITPNTTLRAVFEALVGRLTGLDRFVVGSGVASRRSPALESVIGMLLNNLALPADLTGAPCLDTSVGRVQDTVVAALDNQDIPFDRVVTAVDPARSVGRTPLCQVFFSSYDGPIPAFTLPDHNVEPVFGINNGSAKFDLNVIVVATPAEGQSLPTRRYEMIWEHRSDLFERDSVQRWADWFVGLLESALAAPDCPLSQLPLMSPIEREQVVVSWNRTERHYPRDSTLPALFADVVDQSPERIALVAGDEEISYRELARRAEAVAVELRALGVGPGARVGLCLERSPGAIAAMIGTLQLGAAYVPLDPADPPARRELLTREASLDLVYGDPDLPASPTRSTTVGAADVAYIMFTSGSTGPPKGVEVTHRNVARLVCNTDYADLGPDQVLLHMAPLTFDASTFEIWGALLNGARLVLWPRHEIDLTTLGEVIDRQGVTTLWLTSSLLHVVVQSRLEAISGLRQLLAGGDVLRPDDINQVQAAYPDLRIVNGYGPTEATTFSCCHQVPSDPVIDTIPIGRPIANTTAYVLDAELAPVPVGVPGELFIGGDGVANGYVNAPELTAARFLADPFGADGGTLYRTGDQARWRADGQLEFLGRIDRQVKVRGFRIEPSEVETAISSIPLVRDAAVTTPTDGSGHRLHAFVAAAPGVTAATLRSELAERVPGHLIPSGFTFLEQLPRTRAGKTDYASLPDPEVTNPAGGNPPVMPRDDTEAALVEIWEQVLARSGIGVGDDFFELGGHSLLAVRLIAAVETRLNRRVPLTSFLEFSTVEKMARALRSTEDEATIATADGIGLPEDARRDLLAATAGAGFDPLAPGLAGLNRHGSKPPLFWCFNRLSLEPGPLAEQLGDDQPLYAMLSGAQLIDWGPETADELADHYLPSLLAIQPEGPYRLGGNCTGGRVAIALAQRLRERGATVERLCILEHFEPVLYRHDGPMLLLYGRESHLEVHRSFSWRQDGWDGRFRSTPTVVLTPGGHGEFFMIEPNLEALAVHVADFLVTG